MKITVISDTHNQHLKFEMLDIKLPDADVIIHCGDFSNKPEQMEYFVKWYSSLNYNHKILIAGNHDFGLEDYETLESFKQLCNKSGIVFLHDSGVTIEGINFWGSPWSNEFGNWAFMADEFELQLQAWDYIPDDTNVLITHGPAKGLGDEVYQTYGHEQDKHVGSITLRQTVERLPNLKYHFVGHIHEDAGIHYHPDNNFITYNAASWNYYESGLKEPYVFEIKKEKL